MLESGEIFLPIEVMPCDVLVDETAPTNLYPRLDPPPPPLPRRQVARLNRQSHRRSWARRMLQRFNFATR